VADVLTSRLIHFEAPYRVIKIDIGIMIIIFVYVVKYIAIIYFKFYAFACIFVMCQIQI
jgi:hypothetical protein